MRVRFPTWYLVALAVALILLGLITDAYLKSGDDPSARWLITFVPLVTLGFAILGARYARRKN